MSYGTQLMRQAARIAINRTVAGVHFPVDSIAGALLGLTLGQYLVNRISGVASYQAYEFDGVAFDGLADPELEDFDWSELYDVTGPAVIDSTTGKPYVGDLGAQPIPSAIQSPALVWLWNKAVTEWA